MNSAPARSATPRPGFLVGGFFDDVVSAVEAPFTTAADAVSAIVGVVPGGDWVKGAFDSGKSWIGDMARTSWGFSILTVISGQLEILIGGAAAGGGSAALVGALGPQVASLAWALPGVAKGDCGFSQAYVGEFLRRLKQLKDYFAGGSGLGDSLIAQIEQLVDNGAFRELVNSDTVRNLQAQAASVGVNLDAKQALAKAGASPDALAAKFNTRADATANATNLVLCQQVYDTSNFDLATGASPQIVITTPANVPLPTGVIHDPAAAAMLPIPPLAGTPSATDVLTAILSAQHAGVDNARLSRLVDQYNGIMAAMPVGGGAPAHPGVVVSSPTFAVVALIAGLTSLAIMTAPAWGTYAVLHRHEIFPRRGRRR
jgi:hypothetical protein